MFPSSRGSASSTGCTLASAARQRSSRDRLAQNANSCDSIGCSCARCMKSRALSYRALSDFSITRLQPTSVLVAVQARGRSEDLEHADIANCQLEASHLIAKRARNRSWQLRATASPRELHPHILVEICNRDETV